MRGYKLDFRRIGIKLSICSVAIASLGSCGQLFPYNGSAQAQTGAQTNPMWIASFEILDFLPIVSANLKNGLIVTGYGTPPGGQLEYRATVLISDMAIDASALKVSLETRSGPVDPLVVEGIEKAILNRARQVYGR